LPFHLVAGIDKKCPGTH